MHSKTMAATLLAGTAVLGTAGAAAADTPVDGAVKTVTGIVQNLPAGAPEALAAGQSALSSGLSTPAQKESKTLPAKVGQEHGASLPGADLLGGLPVAGDAARGGLPTDALTGAVPGGLPGVG
ncbi:hypothetical protein [Streptomyces cinnamoneus]|uniref:hypothetical protein n=1 Tax=Streptomyces cinnamoneus TaxID=53446 RepID=UPI0037A8B1AF